MSQVVRCKQINLDKIQINTPLEKSKGKFISYMTYHDYTNPFYIQTSNIKISTFDDSHISFVIDAKMKKVLQQIEQKCIDTIHLNSKDFFHGKIFSKEKIENSFISMVTKDGDDDVDSIHCFFSDNLIIKDQKNLDRQLQDLYSSQNAVAILQIKGIVYKKTSMQLLVTVEQLKIYVVDKLSTWCIENDQSEYTDSSTETESEVDPLEEVENPELVELKHFEHLEIEPETKHEITIDLKDTALDHYNHSLNEVVVYNPQVHEEQSVPSSVPLSPPPPPPAPPRKKRQYNKKSGKGKRLNDDDKNLF